ncbi:AraC family transcriptional regulator [Actinocrispum wychmicini]|uniref:Helix-turn-helix protein n=1 Tax=Actinocrispum wychmicini TaxID=1213861 RepID=A0A4R2J7H4_9PSEU|nr:AraC family transcriptional regulator [Actinocrispum wychmicini]TCO55063.1 helix-turn-helix protein [Actinocrispum wychmicini]
MAETTLNFAVSPHDGDALSDVLQAVHLHGGAMERVFADHVNHPSGTRLLHIVETGSARVECPGGVVVDLGVGDLALLARGDAHTIRAVPTAQWVTGQFVVDNLVADPLLGVLPPVVVIRADTAWLSVSLDLILVELVTPRPGSRVMLSRVLDLLFIHALRAWAADNRHASPGWLTAAMDPRLGPVLSAIHQAPGRDWSVTELARLATLSRSAFATRFATLLGQPPAAYVHRQRLERAAHLLLSTTEPVGRVAERVGYASEAAFSRAFTRAYGKSPRSWRRTG